MKKTWILVLVGFILIVTTIGVGGKMYMDKKAEEKEAERIEIERKSVKALKERYANIKSVEIEKTVYNKMSGSYSIFVKMINDKDKSISFSYTFVEERQELGSAIIKNEEDADNIDRGKTTSKVKVIYSNNEKDEV